MYFQTVISRTIMKEGRTRYQNSQRLCERVVISSGIDLEEFNKKQHLKQRCSEPETMHMKPAPKTYNEKVSYTRTTTKYGLYVECWHCASR
jgi:hypothetical protein